MEDRISVHLRNADYVSALADLTETNASDWLEMDGPDSGVGADYWFVHGPDDAVAYLPRNVATGIRYKRLRLVGCRVREIEASSKSSHHRVKRFGWPSGELPTLAGRSDLNRKPTLAMRSHRMWKVTTLAIASVIGLGWAMLFKPAFASADERAALQAASKELRASHKCPNFWTSVDQTAGTYGFSNDGSIHEAVWLDEAGSSAKGKERPPLRWRIPGG